MTNHDIMTEAFIRRTMWHVKHYNVTLKYHNYIKPNKIFVSDSIVPIVICLLIEKGLSVVKTIILAARRSY